MSLYITSHTILCIQLVYLMANTTCCIRKSLHQNIITQLFILYLKLSNVCFTENIENTPDFLFESPLSLSLSLSLTLLYDTIILSTELLLHMPSSADRLKNSVSSLFEEWWRLGLEGRFDLVTNTLIYLLQRSLSHKGVTGRLKCHV